MKHSVLGLIVLLTLSNTASAAVTPDSSWTFTMVSSLSGGNEDVTNKTTTTFRHSGTVNVTLDATDLSGFDCSFPTSVELGINGATIYSPLAPTSKTAITNGCRYLFQINSTAGYNYYLQVSYGGVRDTVTIQTYAPAATVMAEGEERGEWGDDVVRAYCPTGYTATGGYCKIWDDDENHYDPSPDAGILGSNYYQCRNPFSIYEDRYTRSFVECN